jgi:hypothetical protein
MPAPKWTASPWKSALVVLVVVVVTAGLGGGIWYQLLDKHDPTRADRLDHFTKVVAAIAWAAAALTLVAQSARVRLRRPR